MSRRYCRREGELEAVLAPIYQRAMMWVNKHGLLRGDDDSDEERELSPSEPPRKRRCSGARSSPWPVTPTTLRMTTSFELPPSPPLVIDESKAFAKAIRAKFGSHALVQRCQVHKQRNVEDHLPEDVKRNPLDAYAQGYKVGEGEYLAREVAKVLDGASAPK